VHEAIYREFCLGIVREDSRQAYRRVIGDLVDRGAEGILLGCTEIDLLLPARATGTMNETRRGRRRDPAIEGDET
jgi:aspartate/glutamate racemase